MISETAVELVTVDDFTIFWFAVTILIFVKVFVYFSSKCK